MSDSSEREATFERDVLGRAVSWEVATILAFVVFDRRVDKFGGAARERLWDLEELTRSLGG